ncbi:MAG: hypothetical protein WCH46_03060 [bacterium]
MRNEFRMVLLAFLFLTTESFAQDSSLKLLTPPDSGLLGLDHVTGLVLYIVVIAIAILSIALLRQAIMKKKR